jgi:ribosomal protein L37AE/L43A
MKNKTEARDFCPECGSYEIRRLGIKHLQCERCYQEFFTDVDYTDALAANLSRWYKLKSQREAELIAVIKGLMSALEIEMGDSGTRTAEETLATAEKRLKELGVE